MSKHQVIVDEVLTIKAPAARVWERVTDWPLHGTFIPLTKVETVGGPGRHVGGKFRAFSGIGTIGFWDPITVTSFEPDPKGGGHCEFVHTGRVVRGDAAITVTPVSPDSCQLRWVERFDFTTPELLAWRAGGRAAITSGLRRSMRGFARLVDADT